MITKKEILDAIHGKMIISCQAVEDEPLYVEEKSIMYLMARAAKQAGTPAIRTSSIRDVIAIKEETGLPVIGLVKIQYPGYEGYITPTMKEVDDLVAAGSDVVALDCTLRKRGDGITVNEFIAQIKEKYPDLHIIHFDAHADLRDDYLGARLSHACVIRRCYDILGDGRIHQFCIRSGEREEFRFAKEHTDFHPFTFEGLEETVEELVRKQVPVYFTIDLDCLDPSVFPGTGTPEAGGVSFLELLAAIRKVSELNIVAADVNELAPMLDPSGVSTATACKVVRELLLALAK